MTSLIDNPRLKDAFLAAKAAAQPAPSLGRYVARALMNTGALEHWWGTVRQPGEPDLDPNPHITVAYSRADFPWDCDPTHVMIHPLQMDYGVLGKNNAVVVHLDSPILQSRYAACQAAGATSDYPSYQPHMTLFYLGAGYDSTDWRDGTYPSVPPFPLIFGPELTGPLGTDVFDAAKGTSGEPRGWRFNQNHDPKSGEFAAGDGSDDSASPEAYASWVQTPNDAVTWFRGNGYETINDALRGTTMVRPDLSAEEQSQIRDAAARGARLLDHAIEHDGETLTDTTETWRGLNPDQFGRFGSALTAGKASGMTIMDAGFTSVSTHRQVAARYGQVLLSVSVPSGSRVLRQEDDFEPQMILPRGGSFTFGQATKDAKGRTMYDVTYRAAH